MSILILRHCPFLIYFSNTFSENFSVTVFLSFFCVLSQFPSACLPHPRDILGHSISPICYLIFSACLPHPRNILCHSIFLIFVASFFLFFFPTLSFLATYQVVLATAAARQHVHEIICRRNDDRRKVDGALTRCAIAGACAGAVNQ